MEENRQKIEMFRVSHILILVIYTFFSIVLIGESILLGWELWAIPLVVVGIGTSWWMHISQYVPEKPRLWFYATLWMTEFFYYGIHLTSMYDMSVIMAGVMIIFGMTGILQIVTFAQVTYFITYFYNIFVMLSDDSTVWDSVIVTRTLLHIVVVLIIGYFVRIIVHEWEAATKVADDKILNLQQATHRMDDFLVNVSHEIRTPVNAVIGVTTVLMDKKDRDIDDVKGLNAVNLAGHRIAEQIGDILDYTEIDMDKLVVTNETYMMASLLNDLVTELTATFSTDLELIIDVDAKLPRALSGDPVKIKKVMRHLIINGLKFTKSGGVYVHIYPQKRVYGINLCIEVKDTGSGMSKEEIDHVFEGFYQSDSGRSRSISGLGLGTSIVYGFVRSMGGFLTIDSQVDIGTTVTVSIPQYVVDESCCMAISNIGSLCIASLFRYRQYSDPQVRAFYNDMVLNLAGGLNLAFYQAESMDNLRDLLKKYKLTHLFIGAEEYYAEPSFYERTARDTMVVVVADEKFEPRENTKVIIIRKPFYCFPVIKILETSQEQLKPEKDDRRMITPWIHALVVDDEPMNLIVAEGIFKKYCMDVTVANSGMEAISLCKVHPYDIIFMDHMMPEMDGIEAMRKIKALRPGSMGKKETLFIALTANVISSARDMFIAEGFDGFVAKPIEIIELERVLKRLLPASAIQYVDEKILERSAKPAHKATEPQKEEPKEDKKEDPDGFDSLRKAGLNVDEGISYSQNDPGFYEMILREYGTKAADKKKELEDFYAAKDWDNYTIRIHALKSTSKMIGAMDLFETAKDLEAASKEKDEEKLAGHGDCMKRYDEVATAILEYLGDK
ncbi:MAG: response regulator [Lachnospiraceae bacterium]|nr:response regulator [Lachnospiraceae bacterium]